MKDRTWHCIEYSERFDECSLFKTLATDAKDALYQFYEHVNYKDSVYEKAIKAQDSIEDALKLFAQQKDCSMYHIINIFTIGSWLHCSELDNEKED